MSCAACEFTMKQNDTAPALTVRLSPASTDLTGASVVFNMKNRSTGAVKVNRGTGAVVTATGTPTVQYVWQAGDTDTAGRYHGEFEVTYADSTVETFPSSEFIEITIKAEIA